MISRNDAATIEGSVRSVVDQHCDDPFEVVVAASGTDGTADLVRARFPSVTVVDVPEPGLPGAARNAGLAVARGEFVSFPGSHVELPPGQPRRPHQGPRAGLLDGDRLDPQRDAKPRQAGPPTSSITPRRCRAGPPASSKAVPAHCSYAREALLEAGGFPEDMRAGEDTVLNAELWRRGHRAYRAQDVLLTHRNRCTTPLRLVRHHFVRGRALGRILMGGKGGWRVRRGVIAYLHSYPRWRMRESDKRLARWGGPLRPRYDQVRRLVMLGIASACAGAAFEAVGGHRPAGGDRQSRR